MTKKIGILKSLADFAKPEKVDWQMIQMNNLNRQMQAFLNI